MPKTKRVLALQYGSLPDLQTEYNSLDGDLKVGTGSIVYHISGNWRLIKGDGSSAPQQLGLVECPLIDDLNWAQAVRDALKAGLKNIPSPQYFRQKTF